MTVKARPVDQLSGLRRIPGRLPGRRRIRVVMPERNELNQDSGEQRPLENRPSHLPTILARQPAVQFGSEAELCEARDGVSGP